jgi:hypothetical protein
MFDILYLKLWITGNENERVYKLSIPRSTLFTWLRGLGMDWRGLLKGYYPGTIEEAKERGLM